MPARSARSRGGSPRGFDGSPREAFRAGAIAFEVAAWACRLCAIALCALTVALCFSGLTAKLNVVGLVVDLSRALPSAIAGYGVMTSPFGGVYRLDFAAVAFALFLIDYACMRASRAMR